MFEYSNTAVVLLGGFSIFGLLIVTILAMGKAQYEGKKSYAPIWGTIVSLISVWVMIDEGVSSKEAALASYEKFEKQGEIICSSVGNQLIVSKARGWKRYNDGFSKEDLLMNIRQCRVKEK